ncbi:GNAT family protein [Cellulosilyticum sp. ST5]|uniref:GCN5-related N-acetyltransferase n=1 Tax=Cellulosilyticum lentocellum (strain ATCC 49066 / DSM 5427 / NCIMB 11756 / RHM5) TaxID=642492 RepID=F2JMW2_CELLD|nr:MULTISPECIES: GNAT family protein [Cellulosilyticum]ADZ85877.1 GCN5-related N-acetyltransferase [Cellulosilyticum lentocellum DSM 5427]QEH67373.1 GNAT family N-acetyltransferase [Cellulosilyticum sp. WCF-2]
MQQLETERLVIRRFKEEDWKDLYEYLSDEEVVRYEPYQAFSIEASQNEAKSRAESPAFLAVCLKENNKLIGNIYFAKQEFKTWEIGYVFNRSYQGRGYATEAANAVIAYGFNTRGARRIVAMCNPLNTASWRLLERLGMRREGHLKQNIYFKKDEKGNPIWSDTYEYAILKDEYIKQ